MEKEGAESPERKQKFSTIADNLKVCVCEIDSKGIIISANLTYKGITPAQAAGASLASWFPQKHVINSLIKKVFSTLEPQITECSFPNPQGELRTHVIEINPNIVNGHAERACFMAIDITEQILASEAHQAHLYFLESMDMLNQAITQADDLSQMMSDVLKTVLSILKCDRAWLVFPCDPNAASFRVPMEQTVPEWPGAFELNIELEVNSDVIEIFKTALNSKEPIAQGPEEVPEDIAKNFSVQSQLHMAIYPKVGRPWIFGIHQCSYSRKWTRDDKKIFQEIGRRISDGLSSMLLLQEIQEREERYRLLFENSGVLVSVYSREGVCLLMNNLMATYFGGSPADYIGRSIDDIYLISIDKYSEKIKGVIESGKIRQYEDTLVFPSGIHSLLSIIHPVKDVKGNIFAAQIVSQDITDRVKIEEELRQSENKFHSLYDAIPDGVVLHKLIFNDEGVPVDYMILDVNPAFVNHTGLSYETAVGKKGSELSSSGEPPDFDIFKNVALSGESTAFETYFEPLQKHFHIAVCSPAKGQFATIVKDITLIKNIENDLRKAKEEAENATELKDKFVSIVAHDLRNPISSISGLLNIVLENKELHFTDEQKRPIKLASENAKKIGKLTEEILNMSRLKQGKLRPKFRFISPHQLASNAINTIENNLKQKGVGVENRLPKEKILFSDALLVNQVIENLLSNAVKFSNSGDSITIYQPEGEPNTIAVSDAGLGIPHKKLKDLFDFEKKTSTPGTAGETGIGFGLPFSMEIIKALGGELTVESEESKGSTFYAKFSAIKPKILVVDDEEIFRLEQRTHLARLGAEIIEAANGEDALSIINKNKIHLIITDIKMPIMDGIELLGRVKDNPATEDIPVIIVTGIQEMENQDEAFKNNADDFVRKPFDPEELVPKVKKFLYC